MISSAQRKVRCCTCCCFQNLIPGTVSLTGVSGLGVLSQEAVFQLQNVCVLCATKVANRAYKQDTINQGYYDDGLSGVSESPPQSTDNPGTMDDYGFSDI